MDSAQSLHRKDVVVPDVDELQRWESDLPDIFKYIHIVLI